ncbi:hypothetical protein B0A54_06494 [Friedmanniomyces endolithicus]|uniref:DUF7732 domain-containing protein n=1 Tax=Friedmanniomyces endolithicus TaxID=329885 RepID=A0A4U0V1S3_9PEZI|nr:hypothetical protein LTS09_011551 [Friedmanniomyces endolithicus]TKA41606.1 hypothetical protein B0A54_06494 [Friedmanniomyces endolithicus]
MKIPQKLLLLLGIITTIHALALPASLARIAETSKDLFKRKGGGGGRGSSGSSISSGSSSSSSSGSRSGISSTTSNTGGRTTSGSGITPSYGGGRYYGGGASAPYSAGSRSPGGVAPYLLAGSALAFFSGAWLYGAYAYPYHGAYTYHNDTGNRNETRPVQCFCGRYAECGCDNNADSSYLSSVANNATVSRVADVNGTSTLLINGTLENGTTASGGSDSAAGSLRLGVVEKGSSSGWWLIYSLLMYAVWFL